MIYGSRFVAIVSMLTVINAYAEGTIQARAEALVREAFAGATPTEWDERLRQDEAQRLCSLHRNTPPAAIAHQLLEAQQRTLRYPANGKLMGDWRKGEKLAAIGTGGHIGKIQPDRPGIPRGGNCYACHTLATKEIAAGNLGPSLTHFGKLRGVSPEMVKYTYEKIFNAQAFHPCSMMPRFGHNSWLTPEEVADAVAYLLDPESPVNQ
ncbi:MAG: sulfur oxidation c-type cytochrome SoxX [Betaproteobacteria bacterium]|nr:sulfur oxidation c-type cytochrome SoxX [Betaproteobacteria bacterium]